MLASCGARASATRGAATSTRCCATCPRCASAIRSCTSNTASDATWGSTTLDLGDGPNEFLHLLYANDAKLYVPVSSLHVISRYSGASPEAAPLHELGSGQWDKAKKKAAQQAHDTAAELLNLYAQRAAQAGPRVQVQPARLRGIRRGLWFRGDARPGGGDRSGDPRSDIRQADGQAGLRRRRVRQDRSGAARGIRRGRGRQAGRGAGADDAAGRAAFPDFLRPLRRPAGEDRRTVALPLGRPR